MVGASSEFLLAVDLANRKPLGPGLQSYEEARFASLWALRPGCGSGSCLPTLSSHVKSQRSDEDTSDRFAAGVGGRPRGDAHEGKGIRPFRDALAAERRRMPWMLVEREYEFDGPSGKASLLDLVAGRKQLIVYLRARGVRLA